MNGGTAVVAAVLRARRKVLSRLQEAGATSAETALAFEPDRRLERKAVDYFRRKGVILEPQPGEYFMLPDKADAWRKTVRKRAAIAGGVAAAIAAAAAILAINA
jgi:hypothetical protein